MSKIPPEIHTIKESWDQEILSYREIKEGQDGKKFVLETRTGKFFCKIKKISGGQELPFQEEEILQSADSDLIIKPIHVDQIRGQYIIIRPYLEGEPLDVRLSRGTLERSESAALLRDLLEAVSSLQEVGAVHFDIKPENIIAGTDGRYYLIDFGAARFVNKIKNEKIFPARRYIAPEVLEYLFSPNELAVQRLNTLTDMYGIGAVVYTCLTGRRLSDFFEHSSDILQKTPPPIKSLVPTIEPVEAQLIDRLLAKDPSRRLLPAQAQALLEGSRVPGPNFPQLFLKTKGGKGSEHASMLAVIEKEANRGGLYWKSPKHPQLPPKSFPPPLLWETSAPSTEAELERDLLAQQSMAVIALCVPGNELDGPLDPAKLAANLKFVDHAAEWRKTSGVHLPVLPILPLDAALLLSPDIKSVRAAYAGRSTDGLILRVCVSTNGEQLTVQHLRAIRDFIAPWKDAGKPVLLDADLSTLVLVRAGVTSYICTTFPKTSQLVSRAATTPPRGRPQKPDGFYVKKLLGKISADQVTSLRGNPVGRALTDCPCPYCANTLMKRGKLAAWSRQDRRSHFVHVLPREIKRLRDLPLADVRDDIANAKRTITRYKPLVPMSVPYLDAWTDFLSS